jgi:hypothetical protein
VEAAIAISSLSVAGGNARPGGGSVKGGGGRQATSAGADEACC